MIKKLIAQNIKCFDLQEFTISPLTVFCGGNSVGKSTALQCLLLLRQSFNRDNFNSNEISLMGEYFSVGHASDIIYHYAAEPEIAITIDQLSFRSSLDGMNREDYILPFNSLPNYEHDFFTADFIYLSAERLGPRNSYEVSFDSNGFNTGVFGEFAMSEFIKRASTSAINQDLVKLTCSSPVAPHERVDETSRADELTLEIAVKTVMRSICPGFDIKYESHKTVDRVSNTYSSPFTKTSVRPINTGFGISYIFPIIVAAFCIERGGTFILENPEVHLHPQAQAALSIFLAQLSQTGIQVILETHSDHVINAMRVFSKDTNLQTDHIAINSIGRIDAKREVRLIRIDSDGNLSSHQEGFFDQTEKDLLRLF